MINIYMCEDEQMQLSHLEKIIKEYLLRTHKDAQIVSSRNNPIQIIDDIKGNEGTPSLFLIDVQLKGYAIDGFALARNIKKTFAEPYFVFLTSKDELAYKVFEYELGILDYIIKRPTYFSEKSINKSLESRFDHIFQKIEQEQYRKNRHTIVVECGSRMLELVVDDIIYIDTVNGKHLVEIHTIYQNISIRESLKNMYMQVEEKFIHINKSCIVQKNKIIEVDKKNRFVTLTGGYHLEVSYREMKSIFSMLQNKLNSGLGEGDGLA